MIEKVEIWVKNYLSVRRNMVIDWNNFSSDVKSRFKDETEHNAIEQFNKLEQTRTLEKYFDAFEELKAHVQMNGHILPDSFVL